MRRLKHKSSFKTLNYNKIKFANGKAENQELIVRKVRKLSIENQCAPKGNLYQNIINILVPLGKK